MERLRRLVFVVLLAAGVWCFFHADLSPLVTVAPERRPPRGVDEIHPVRGADWAAFLAEVDEAAAGRGPEAWRCGPEQEGYGISRRLFYRPDEGPFAAIAAGLPKPWGVARLEHQGRIYDLQRVTIQHDDFQFGSGYSSLAPPDRFFRPWRFLSPWLMAAALLAYIAISWPRRAPGDIAHARWRVVMSDLLSTLLFLPFFALPFFIIGGALQTIVVGWPLLIGLWFMAALGLWAFYLAAWSSALAVRVGDDGLMIRSFADWKSFPFAAMCDFGPAIRKSPRWMRVLGVLAAFSGRSGGGAAMLSSSLEYGGLAIRLSAGQVLFLWICTPLGAPTMEGAERIPEALRAAGLAEFEEPLVHVGFGRGLLVPSSKVEAPPAVAT